jgi:autotransporter-associated beta strand protein
MNPAKPARFFGLVSVLVLMIGLNPSRATLYYDATPPSYPMTYGTGTISTTSDADFTSSPGASASYVNWSNSTSDTLQIGSNTPGYYTGGSTAGSFSLTLAQATSLGLLEESGNLTSGNTVTITDGGTAGNTLTFGGSGTTDNIQNNSVNNPLIINARILSANGGAGLYDESLGTVILTNSTANSYGATVIESGGASSSTGGTLQIGNGGTIGSLGSGTVTLAQYFVSGTATQTLPSTLAFDRSDSAGITVSNTINVSTYIGGTISQIGTGTLNLSGSINNNSTGTLTVNVAAGDSAQISGAIGGTGSGLFVKSGAGTLQISGTNTYTGGTSITAGNLQVTNTSSSSSATGSGGVSLGSATLSGTGYVTGAVTATGASGASNITVATTGSVGTLTLNGGVTSSTGLTLNLAVDGAAGANSLLSLGSANLSVSGSALTFNLYDQGSNLLTPNTPYLIVSSTGSLTASSITASLSGSTQYTLKTSYGTDGISISGGDAYFEVQSVPEPSTWALMLGGLALLVFYQRRRHEAARAGEMPARS